MARGRGHDRQVEDLNKARGLDLSKPHGAQAEGLCGVGMRTRNGMGLEEGHSRQAIVIPLQSRILQMLAILILKRLPLMVNTLILDIIR